MLIRGKMLTQIKSPHVRRWGCIRARDVSAQPNLTSCRCVCLASLGHSCGDREREGTVCLPHTDMPLLLDVDAPTFNAFKAVCMSHEPSKLVCCASLHCDQPTCQENNLQNVCRLPCLEHTCIVLLRWEHPRAGKHTTAAQL